MDDLISRQAAIDALNVLATIGRGGRGDGKSVWLFACTIANEYADIVKKRIEALPSSQADLITKIQNGIKATDADNVYSCGMRNGMRWCMSLIDDKEPMYENCPSSQAEIIRCKDCRWGRETCGNIECFVDTNIPPEYHGYDWYCPNGERRTDETDY